MTPGRKPSSTTSDVSASFRKRVRPSSIFKFRLRLFLPRFRAPNRMLSPLRIGGMWRSQSPPPGGSILITSAPKSARMRVQKGPGSSMVRSSTRIPARGAAESVSDMSCLSGCCAGYYGRQCARHTIVAHLPSAAALGLRSHSPDCHHGDVVGERSRAAEFVHAVLNMLDELGCGSFGM